MNQMTLMNPGTIDDPTAFETAMNAVIIYEDFDCAAKANAMFCSAAHRADEALPWSVKPWRLDLLNRPLTADAALTDAAEAHLVLFSLRRPSSFPAWVLEWLEQWAERRQVQDAALAVWDGGNGDTLSATAAHALTQFADRHGVSFIFGDAGPVEDDLPVLVCDLGEGAPEMTPTLKSIREYAPLVPASDWGIQD
jgi:hypothetical protein